MHLQWCPELLIQSLVEGGGERRVEERRHVSDFTYSIGTTLKTFGGGAGCY